MGLGIMQLSSEDSLRLNVLVANAEAIRVDENALTVTGLQAGRELSLQLHPTCKPEKYLGLVRELLSGVVLGSPGGYPIFLRRWTRMGQIAGDQLDRLLRLGEPEAIMAVVCSPGLTVELARRAWWCAPNAEHARRMLENPRVAADGLGKELAEYLLEYLPFETEHSQMMESVRLVLQPGLIGDERRRRLWEAGRTRKSYRVGFLQALPDALPEAQSVRHDFGELAAPLAAVGGPLATLMKKVLDVPGQTFMEVAAEALRRPADQEVVAALLNAVGRYFAAARVPREEVDRLLAALPVLRDDAEAVRLLAGVSEELVTPIFARSDAVGSVMRTRIEPVVAPLLSCFERLRRGG
jgi:hypothetical protein